MLQSILIVEDDETVAQLLAFIFRHGGFEPTIVGDGRAAAEHVANHAPADAVLLDVMLPCRDGYAVASAIRGDERWAAVPIVMLSGHAADHHEEYARSLNVAAFFEKPFRPLSLLESVKKLLHRAAAA